MPNSIAPNSIQLQGTAATLVGVAAGYAAGHGWLGLDLADWTTLVTGIVVAGTAAWPAVAARAIALKDQVGKLPGTTVVTDKASAEALPANKDVVAATPALVEAIKKAS